MNALSWLPFCVAKFLAERDKTAPHLSSLSVSPATPPDHRFRPLPPTWMRTTLVRIVADSEKHIQRHLAQHLARICQTLANCLPRLLTGDQMRTTLRSGSDCDVREVAAANAPLPYNACQKPGSSSKARSTLPHSDSLESAPEVRGILWALTAERWVQQLTWARHTPVLARKPRKVPEFRSGPAKAQGVESWAGTSCCEAKLHGRRPPAC